MHVREGDPTIAALSQKAFCVSMSDLEIFAEAVIEEEVIGEEVIEEEVISVGTNPNLPNNEHLIPLVSDCLNDFFSRSI